MGHTDIERMLMPNTYVKYMAQAFDDHATLTAGTPLPAQELADYTDPIAVKYVLQCLHNAVAMADRPDWYLDWAQGMAEHYHGPITMAAVSAPTLGDGLDAFLKYMPVRVPYHRWRGFVEDEFFHCQIQELLDFGPVRHMVVEIPLLVLREYVGRLHRRLADGARVDLSYPPTPHHALYREWFDCEVNFDAQQNALVIPAQWRAIRNPGFDGTNWQAALRRCDQASPGLKEKQIAARVRAEVFSSVDKQQTGSPPTLATIADRLHVSARTLIRQLRSAGTNYQAIVDEIQKERAIALLLNEDIPIYEVGAELGFQDPASFGRSFKRWFGMTPGKYRKTVRGGHE